MICGDALCYASKTGGQDRMHVHGFKTALVTILESISGCHCLQAIPCSSLELTSLEIRLHGGLVAAEFDETISHVVFDKW